jgi:hypothetical protein
MHLNAYVATSNVRLGHEFHALQPAWLERNSLALACLEQFRDPAKGRQALFVKRPIGSGLKYAAAAFGR